MTREQLFRETFRVQLAAIISWPVHFATSTDDLAPSDFPSYSLTFGDTKFIAFTPTGDPTRGEQLFTVRYFFSTQQLNSDLMLHRRSEEMPVIQDFVTSGYVPPAPAPGDNYRIDNSQLLEISAPAVSRTNTRFVITFKAKYSFTIL
jgi:hypothetical protein